MQVIRRRRFVSAVPRDGKAVIIVPIQAALDKVALGLMADHARHCVIDGPADLKEDRPEELMAAVARLMRRG